MKNGQMMLILVQIIVLFGVKLLSKFQPKRTSGSKVIRGGVLKNHILRKMLLNMNIM